MDAKRLAEIQARYDAATPGPWVNMSDGEGTFAGEIRDCNNFIEIADMPEMDDRPADFEFIAHAREDVPDLHAEVARLREALAWYADPAHWPNFGKPYPSDIEEDHGDHARAALGEVQP